MGRLRRLGFRQPARSIVRVILAERESVNVEYFGPGSRRECERVAEELAEQSTLDGAIRRVSVLPLHSLFGALSLLRGFRFGGVVPAVGTVPMSANDEIERPG